MVVGRACHQAREEWVAWVAWVERVCKSVSDGHKQSHNDQQDFICMSLVNFDQHEQIVTFSRSV